MRDEESDGPSHSRHSRHPPAAVRIGHGGGRRGRHGRQAALRREERVDGQVVVARAVVGVVGLRMPRAAAVCTRDGMIVRNSSVERYIYK